MDIRRFVPQRQFGPTKSFVLLLLLATQIDAADHWPQFRGPGGQGHSKAVDLPLSWSPTKNVAWRVEILGRGWSSPVVYGDQIWLTTALDEGRSLRAVCVDRADGRIIHDVDVLAPEEPPPKNPKNSFASPTPVVEKDFAYVHFGTMGTACLETASGNIVWTNEALRIDHKEGPGSSPILFGDFLIFNCDGMDVQYVVALDKRNGEVAWRTDRQGANAPDPDLRKAYSTPLVIRHDGRDELVSIGADRVVAYDPTSGVRLWWVDFDGYSNVPRPIYGHGLVLISTGFNAAELLAIRPGGRGNVTDSHVVWRSGGGGPKNPSPILCGEEIYMVTDQGVATCLDAQTGSRHWRERLGGNFSASPVFAEGKIYFLNEEGRGFVLRAGRDFELVATNDLEEPVLASPAAVDRALFVRGEKHLFCIEREDDAATD